MEKHVTIKDIAKELNTSVSTVSKALNEKYFDINPETRQRVLKAAREMGYRPNPIARKLQQGRSYNIGVIVPEFLDTFFPEVIFNIQKRLIKEGYQVVVMSSDESFETELENLKTLEDNMVDGLIISLTRETKNIDYINKIIDRGMPVVLFNRVNPSIRSPKVIFDDFKWSHFATEHLILQGYRNIYHFSLPYHLAMSQKRIQGFKSALKKYRIPFTEEHIIETGISIEEGQEAMKRLLDRDIVPGAVFAAGDKVAIGAIKELKRRGYKIPDQIGVMGFTESALAEIIEPNLTSVNQPTDKIADKIVELLLDSINDNGKAKIGEFLIGGTLNVRESSRVMASDPKRT
ncbi:LacI family DNA-binding transcriptional regulator [Sinomicrobium weinanense]|uniref:LacI family DNA-binding transcriptional regulator n=1 Tax=Sinomicrobium weinanense TaxID=2842200 RepID=A0A926JTB5_9FLAO|nr:LacI family DNA-binding transcriptional regulator [Sinomicrobium weinanense]MBC9797147.1 LacI family DNA-binding transcriptional regulator [Sinomicrobium weinanense]MBU3124488.1 LacI family transcriptional regulator [Sinomicrobium weinanense]